MPEMMKQITLEDLKNYFEQVSCDKCPICWENHRGEKYCADLCPVDWDWKEVAMETAVYLQKESEE